MSRMKRETQFAYLNDRRKNEKISKSKFAVKSLTKAGKISKFPVGANDVFTNREDAEKCAEYRTKINAEHSGTKFTVVEL